jgi:cellulose synthase/poly-beta-1,6-N-acetylglucosamine synthase-like glycosyltransferase
MIVETFQWVIIALITFYVDLNYFVFFMSSLFPREMKYKKITKYQKVSVLIPTKNEAHVIEETLRKLRASDYPKNKLEIIVVDGGSTDNTVKIAKKYAKVIVVKNSKGKAQSLNVAIRKAKGELIYFLDADNWVYKDTISKIVSVMDEYNAVSGDAVVRNKKNLIEKVSNLEGGLHELLMYELSRLFKSEIVSGYNFMIKKNTLKKIGGFRSVLTEDINLSMRLYKAGERIGLVDAKCSVTVPKTAKSYWKQQERWRKGSLDEISGVLKNKQLSFIEAFVKMPFLTISSIVPSVTLLSIISYVIFQHPVFFLGSIFGIMLILSSAIHFDNKNELLYLPITYIYYTILEITGSLNAIGKKLTGKDIGWYKTPK